ncbi:MAG: TrmH family RNA methyltransferase [Acidimicrobiales bacterium]
MPRAERFPREQMITVYGRMPVLEAVLDPRAVVHQVLVARNARGESIDRILGAAADRGIRVERTDAGRVTRASRNGRHDQGVVADIASPGLAELDAWLLARRGPIAVMLLDGLTNPANVGQVIRTVVAAGMDGVVLPRMGSPDVNPLVVKASAGVALHAPIVRAATAYEAATAMRANDVQLIGLRGSDATPLWQTGLPDRVAFVLGNETDGVSAAVSQLVDDWCSLPMSGGVDSLNVASAAAVVAFELVRRRCATGP